MLQEKGDLILCHGCLYWTKQMQVEFAEHLSSVCKGEFNFPTHSYLDLSIFLSVQMLLDQLSAFINSLYTPTSLYLPSVNMGLSVSLPGPTSL